MNRTRMILEETVNAVVFEKFLCGLYGRRPGFEAVVKQDRGAAAIDDLEDSGVRIVTAVNLDTNRLAVASDFLKQPRRGDYWFEVVNHGPDKPKTSKRPRSHDCRRKKMPSTI